jgi:hypothetical protein
MTRPVDWAPLAGGDPVPGDPAEIQRIAQQHAQLADELTAQAGNLRRLASCEGWDAPAGRKFAESAGDVATHLEKARRRYTAVAEALRGYTPQLEQAQREADQALREAKEAQATAAANQPPAPGSEPAGPPTDLTVEADRRRKQNAFDGANDALRRARQKMNNAVALRDQQAKRAAGHIREAIDHDGLKDGFWDKVKAKIHDMAPMLKLIADIASWVATIFGFLSIFGGWIPVVGEILLAITLAATAVSLVCHLALALSGDGSWLDVGLDAIGLLTFGYGKVATRGVKVAQSTVAKQATRATRKGLESWVKARMPGATATQVRREATSMAKEAMQTATTKAKPTVLQVIKSFDLGTARELAKGDAMVALTKGRGGAKVVNQAVHSAFRKQTISSVIGATTDWTDKLKGFDKLKPYAQAGPYAPTS